MDTNKKQTGNPNVVRSLKSAAKLVGTATSPSAAASASRRRLLEFELGRRATDAARKSHDATAPRADRDGLPPLSFAQEGLWLFLQRAPGTTLFQLGTRFTLRGALDVNSLQASLDEIVRRHEALRTGFAARDGLPEAIVIPSCRVSLRESKLDAGPREDRERAIDRASQDFVREPFDLARPPLFRAVLLRAGAQEHVLVVASHHLVFDGWCRSILHNELTALYQAFSAGKPSDLPPLRMQCGDVARRQRRMLDEDRRARLADHWKSRLEGAPVILDLPVDFARSRRSDPVCGRETLALDASISTALKDLGRAHEATPFMVLLAAFATVLSRWSGQKDMLIGVPLAGREDPDVQRVIGLFVNLLPVRVDLQGNPPFVELLRQVRASALETYEHQDLPLKLLLRELKIERRTDIAPLFQVALNYQNHP
ncbi:MAG: condensation domain-containing protein, partial [Opitutaceae bacterium]